MSPVAGHYPLTQPVDIQEWAQTGTDRNGDPVMGHGPWHTVLAFGWAVAPTQEVVGDSLLRTIDTLTVYLPPETAPGPGGRFRLPDGRVWEVQGNPTDYEHNPWFTPGLVVITATRTEG